MAFAKLLEQALHSWRPPGEDLPGPEHTNAAKALLARIGFGKIRYVKDMSVGSVAWLGDNPHRVSVEDLLLDLWGDLHLGRSL